MRILTILLLTTLASLSCEKDSKTSSEAKPEAAKPDPEILAGLPKLSLETFRLANGLNVVLHQDAKMPVVNVNVWYHVGSKDETAGRTGLAHLFEHLMFQGSKHVDGDYFSLAEKAGANLNAGGVDGTTNSDRTNFFVTVPSSSLEYVLWLESDRMGYLMDKLTQENLDNQRKVVFNEKRQQDSRPFSSQAEILSKMMFPAEHPYAHPSFGYIDDIARAQLVDVQAFYAKYYTPNNASLVLSGNFDAEAAKQLILKYFGPLQAGPTLTRPKQIVPKLSQNRLVIRKERVPQSKMTLAWHIPGYFHGDEAALDYAARILGGGMNSLLHTSLVREQKLATNASAYLDQREVSSLFVVEVLVAPNTSIAKVKEVILDQIKSLGGGKVGSKELEHKKASREYQFISSLERIGGFGGKADYFNRYYTFLGTPNAFYLDYDRYKKVESSDVSRVVDEWLVQRHHGEVRFLPDQSTRSNVKEFDRSQTPSLAGNVPVNIPKIETKVLPNGLELYVHTRSDLPKVEATMLIKRGDLGETMETSGLSYMTASMMPYGADGRSMSDIQESLESMGASLASEGSKFGAAVSLASLKKHLDSTFEIFADIVRNPDFNKDEFELVRKMRLERIGQEQSTPATLANTLFPQILFSNKHPAGMPVSGTAESIKALTREQLVQNHQTYWRPNNAALLIVGDITLEEAEKLATDQFGTWKKQELPKAEVKRIAAPQKSYIFLIDQQNAQQTQIRMGSVAPLRNDPSYFTTHVMNGVLGGTFGSRLNMNLREDKGWTYGAYSYFLQRKFYGYWVAQSAVQTKATIVAMNEMRNEIASMSKPDGISDEEFNNTKKNLSRSYLQNFESLNQITRQVAPLITNDVPLNHLNQYITGILGQKKEDIVKAAQAILNVNNVVILVIGDLKLIEKPIVELGWGDTYVLSPDGRVLRKGQVNPPAQPTATNQAPASNPPANAPNKVPAPQTKTTSGTEK